MKTIKDIIHQITFPLEILDSNYFLIYYEDKNGYWAVGDYDENGNEIYYENSEGRIEHTRT